VAVLDLLPSWFRAFDQSASARWFPPFPKIFRRRRRQGEPSCLPDDPRSHNRQLSPFVVVQRLTMLSSTAQVPKLHGGFITLQTIKHPTNNTDRRYVLVRRSTSSCFRSLLARGTRDGSSPAEYLTCVSTFPSPGPRLCALSDLPVGTKMGSASSWMRVSRTSTRRTRPDWCTHTLPPRLCNGVTNWFPHSSFTRLFRMAQG
jgi:hypothetical protein